MRTTLSIDDDVLLTARSLADRQGKSIGEIISTLARQGLRRQSSGGIRNGIPLLPLRKEDHAVSLELVNRLRDESP
jgi:hypothetical protein